MSYEQSFLWALLLTLVVEVPIVFLILRFKYKNFHSENVIFSSILASALTLPYFWFIVPAFISERIVYILLGESVIVLIEAFLYYKLLKVKFTQALLISFIANLASALVGLL